MLVTRSYPNFPQVSQQYYCYMLCDSHVKYGKNPVGLFLGEAGHPSRPVSTMVRIGPDIANFAWDMPDRLLFNETLYPDGRYEYKISVTMQHEVTEEMRREAEVFVAREMARKQAGLTPVSVHSLFLSGLREHLKGGAYCTHFNAPPNNWLVWQNPLHPRTHGSDISKPYESEVVGAKMSPDVR